MYRRLLPCGVAPCLALLFVLLLPHAALSAAADTFAFLAPSPTGNTINDIWTPDSSNYYFVGDGGTILKYDGTAFSQMDSPTWCSLYGVSGTSNSDIWAVGGCEYGYGITDSNRSVILHYNGTAWSKVAAPSDIYGQYLVFTDVWAANTSLVYASAQNTTFLARRNGGAFSYIDTGLGGLYGQFNGMYGFSSSDVYARQLRAGHPLQRDELVSRTQRGRLLEHQLRAALQCLGTGQLQRLRGRQQ